MKKENEMDEETIEFLAGKEFNLDEQIKRDEENCVPGSLAHDEKLRKERLEELKDSAVDGGCVSSK